jgi:GTPase Era involved in 16S rRNA processing
MFDKFTIDMKKVYPTLVISTMSSGKSTLINSLVGKELLPSQNRACTAKTVAILDHDGMDDFQIHAVDENGSYTNIKKATKKAVYNYNATNNVEEMILEGDIRGIKNSKKAMLLIDTPGVNNSMDQTHAEITRETLDEYQEGLILYVINAQNSIFYL